MIRLCAADSQACLDRGIKLDMYSWTEQDKNGGVCSVCAGGAVLFNTLELTDIEKTGEYRHKIDALDFLREGAIAEAYECFYYKSNSPDSIKNIQDEWGEENFFGNVLTGPVIPEYFQYLENVATDLEKAGY